MSRGINRGEGRGGATGNGGATGALPSTPASGLPATGTGNAPAGGLGAARALSGLEGRQAGLLEQIRAEDGPHSAMLTSLVVTNSLLELAKLATMRLSLAEFTQSAVATFAHCVPLDRCALSITAPGLPPLRTETGSWEDVPGGALEHARLDELESVGVSAAPLLASGTGGALGFLAVGGLPVRLVEADVVARAAEQISSVLQALIEAERLRRQAAASRILELLATVDGSYDHTVVETLASELQSLPGAVGASILLELTRFGGPLECRAGQQPPESPTTIRSESLDRSGTVTVKLWWAEGIVATDDADAAADLLARIVETLRRVEHTLRLVEEAETDDLTGIGNRRRASRALAQAIARAQRTGEDVAVLLIDLDRFKRVNDTHGHDVGDRVLRAFGAVVASSIRAYDIAARWGGEEFLVVCPATDVDGARALARRLLTVAPDACATLSGVERQTVSIGIATTTAGEAGESGLVRAADEALYLAKAGGRNRFMVAPIRPMR